MEKFMENELKDPVIEKKITKLFILGSERANALKRNQLFEIMKGKYILVHFTQFILVLFLEQYEIPKSKLFHNLGEEY